MKYKWIKEDGHLRYNPLAVDECCMPTRDNNEPPLGFGLDALREPEIPVTFEDEMDAMGYEKLEHGLYDHFKGGKYVTLFVGRDSESTEPVVVYLSLHHGTVWARPLSNFTATVDRNGKTERRFKLTQPLPLWRRLLLVLKHVR